MKKLIALLFVFATLTVTVGCGKPADTKSTAGTGTPKPADTSATK